MSRRQGLLQHCFARCAPFESAQSNVAAATPKFIMARPRVVRCSEVIVRDAVLTDSLLASDSTTSVNHASFAVSMLTVINYENNLNLQTIENGLYDDDTA